MDIDKIDDEEEKQILTLEVPVSLAIEARIAASRLNISRSELIRRAITKHLVEIEKHHIWLVK